MGAIVIVLVSPILNDGLGVSQIEEQIAIQTFLSELAVKALDVSILPRAARCDI